MKKLLNEFLSYIVEVDEPTGQSKKYPGYYKVPGVNLYAKDPNGPATHRAVKGVIQPIKGKQAPSEKKKRPTRTAQASSTRRKSSKQQTQQPSTAATMGGVELHPEPVSTPGGNAIAGQVSPDSMAVANTAAQQVIDSRRAVSDDLADVDLKQHRSRQLPRSQDDYYADMEKRGLVKQPVVRFDKATRKTLRAAGVSEAHIDLLERAINTTREGDNPRMTELTGGAAGKGASSAQAGEVAALVLMSVPATQRGAVTDAMRRMVNESGSESPILDLDWVAAAAAQSEAFDSMMDAKYGKGNWTVESSAWDTPDDIAGIGLDPKNKGFSTDIALRVRVQGKTSAQVARISLKKNGKVYLFNGTAQDVTTFAIQNLSDVEQQEHLEINDLLQKATSKNSTREEKKAARKQLQAKFGGSAVAALKAARQRTREIEDAAVESLPEPTKTQVQTVRSWPGRQQQSATALGNSLSGRDAVTDAELDAAAKGPPAWDASEREFARKAHEVLSKLPPNASDTDIIKALKAAGLGKNAERMRKAVVYAAAVEGQRDSQIQQELEKHNNLAVEAGNATIDAIAGNDSMRAGLIVKLEEVFPLRVIATGEESMALGGVPVSRETCREMFGTDNPEEIQRGLDIVEKKEPPPPRKILIYRASAGGEEISVATVEARQRGIGYDGSIGLAFKATSDFECKAAAANERAGMNNPENAKILAKCGKK